MDLSLFEKIKPLLQLTEKKTLLGSSAIPWKEVAQTIATNWKLSSLGISCKEQKTWKETELLLGFSENFYLVSLHFSPLAGKVFWIMDHADLAKLCAEFLIQNGPQDLLFSEILQESFYHFLLTQVLSDVVEHSFFHNFSPKIAFESPLPEQACFGTDILIKTPKYSLWGRLLLTSDFVSSWNHYLQKHFPKEEISLEDKQKVVSLLLSVGSFSLSEETWEKIKPGDFITLEEVFYDPHLQAGTGVLFLENMPLFEVTLSEKKVEITQALLPKKPGETLFEVQIAQIPITLEKLLYLKTGAHLPFPILSETLSINREGKKLGEGSFYYLGNRLGILLQKKNLPPSKSKNSF